MKKLFGCVWLLITLTIFSCLSCAQNTSVENQKDATKNQTIRESNEFLVRLNNPRFRNYFASATWTLTHDYSDSKRVDEVLKTVQNYFAAFEKNEKGERADYDRLGGVKAFKDQLAVWLNDEDQAIRAFSAVLLGISGDKTYAPQLANLLKERKDKEGDSIRYDRSRAAMALGMIGAVEYKQNLVELLKSANESDRTGAALGLGFLKAKDEIDNVKKLLKDKDENVRQAAEEALKLMEETEPNKN